MPSSSNSGRLLLHACLALCSLALVGLESRANDRLRTFSKGMLQRIGLAQALINDPELVFLDEPTSALDPLAAEEVLATLQRLVHDLGLTVVLAEHRLERVVQYADRVILVPGEAGPVLDGTPHEVLTSSPIAPPCSSSRALW